MSRRTTAILAILNLALLSFVYFVERGQLSTGDVLGRRGHLLTRFVRDRVERVALQRGEEPSIVFVRERAEEEDDGAIELGTWNLVEPLDVEADDDAVDSLLSALEWLDARRTLTEISDADREQFGLTSPRFVVRFTVADEQVELRVGDAAPTGEGVYAAVEGDSRAYVVGEDLVEALDHDVDHFRSRELFRGFYPSDALSMALDGGGPTIELVQEERQWHVRAPVEGHAAESLVDTLSRVVREVRVARFVEDDPESLDPYGLSEPWRELIVSRSEDVSGPRRARLTVGAVCGEHEDERYARGGDDGPVVCVSASAVTTLEVDRAHLREARLTTLGADTVERIELTVGETSLELSRGEQGWEITTGDAEAASADDAAIAGWLTELRSSRVLAFDDNGPDGHSLDRPRATLVLHRSDREAEHRLVLGDASEDGVWLRRDAEPVAARLPMSVEPLLLTDALRFRQRRLVEEVLVGQARVVTLTSDGVEQRAVRVDDADWRLEAPMPTGANRVVVRDIARQLAELSATRFVTDTPTEEHGLATPSVVASVRFEPEEGEARTVTLAIGTQTVDGAYARLDGAGPVFEISRELYETVRKPLVSLDLMTVETEEIAQLRITRGTESVEVRREGAAWQTAEGESPDPAQTRALLDRLATLRGARLVAYAAGEGAEVDVQVTRRAGTEGARTVTLHIGAVVGEGEDAFVPVWRDDPAVTLGFRPELVDVFRTYAP
ncbi:MAG: DUF4340 domain-containing protein [Sandaracinaceae bacterium]